MFVFLMAIVIYPLVDAFRISLFREVGVNVRYEGLGNYRRLLQSNVFWHGLQVSAIYTVASVALHLVVGLPAALFLSRVRRGRKALRLLLLVPWMVAEVYGATMWVWMLDPNFGVLNYMLRGAGIIRQYQAWLGQPGLALTSVILVDAWRGFPFVTLLLLAGLMTIPMEEYEAAAIDGAGRLQQLRYVTLPHLVEILGVSTTLDVINTIRRFGIIAVMTKGGPVDATEALPMLIYNSAFVANDFGRVAATGVLLLFVLLVLSALYIFQLQPTGSEGNGR
jgi:multiple sugar transport system permease protein